MKKLFASLFAFVALALGFASPSFAVGVDVTSVVTTIGDQLTPIGLVGAAVLSLIVAIKAYKWVRRAL